MRPAVTGGRTAVSDDVDGDHRGPLHRLTVTGRQELSDERILESG